MQEMEETRVQYLSQEDPLEEGMATTQVFLPGKSHEWGAWQATAHRVQKSQTHLKRLSTHTSRGHNVFLVAIVRPPIYTHPSSQAGRSVKTSTPTTLPTSIPLAPMSTWL